MGGSVTVAVFLGSHWAAVAEPSAPNGDPQAGMDRLTGQLRASSSRNARLDQSRRPESHVNLWTICHDVLGSGRGLYEVAFRVVKERNGCLQS